MRALIIIFVFSVFGSALKGGSLSVSADEDVVFFTTVAHFDESTSEWVVPIHGWIYEPEDSVIRKAGIERTFEKSFGLSVGRATRSNFDRRVNLLLVDNERGKRIEIKIGEQTYLLNAAQPNGHFMDELRLTRAEVEALPGAGVIDFEVCLAARDRRSFRGRALLWKAEGVTVLSDLDDTVKISVVSDRRKLMENTFFLEFQPVPGMAQQYQEWAQSGADFQFVSSSPWQLYEPLNEFLVKSGFPEAALSLKSIRLKDRTILNLFKKGTETKPVPIEALMWRFPLRQFILVGDSGEQDPEVYAEIYRKYPKQVRAIYIRDVSGANLEAARFSSVFEDVPKSVWHIFSDASTIAPVDALRSRDD